MIVKFSRDMLKSTMRLLDFSDVQWAPSRDLIDYGTVKPSEELLNIIQEIGLEFQLEVLSTKVRYNTTHTIHLKLIGSKDNIVRFQITSIFDLGEMEVIES